jgi:predicted transcriptional regulator
MKSEGAITENELIKYITEKGTVHAFRIGEVDIFCKAYGLAELNEKFNFNPPQSFSIADDRIERALTGKL